jgi:S1-C subfamily serine protease
MRLVSGKIAGSLLLLIFVFSAGFAANKHWLDSSRTATAEDLRLDEQEATIRAINKVMPAVVSIIVYDYKDFVALDVPSGKKEIRKYRKKLGEGTGFLISSDGYILTNKHVVAGADPKTGEYRVILNSGKEYYAQLIGIDPLNDLAVIKIFDKNLPLVELGDSDRLSIGASVIAIGNALGRYDNSATKGIVSAVGRSLVASDQSGYSEALDNLIQTDAKINVGNSGGPLIDLFGRVVGINTAVEAAGSAIGFAIPINDARPVIKSVKERGRIVRPYLGVRYRMLTPLLARDNNLPRTSGAWITAGESSLPAVVPGSPAAKAGIQAGDIIFEINAIKIKGIHTLLSIVGRYQPGDRIGLKIQRGHKVIIRIVTLEEYKGE